MSRTLADLCARVVYALFGAVTVGLSAASLSGCIGWLSGVGYGHNWFGSAAYPGMVIGIAVGALVGLFGKMTVVTGIRDFWTGIPYAIFGALVVGEGLACIAGLAGLMLSLLIHTSWSLPGSMALVSGVFGALIGCGIGFRQRNYTGDFFEDVFSGLAETTSSIFDNTIAVLCLVLAVSLVVCLAIARFLA